MDLSFSVGFVSPATGRRGFGGGCSVGEQGQDLPTDLCMIGLTSVGVNRRFNGLPSELPATPFPPSARRGALWGAPDGPTRAKCSTGSARQPLDARISSAVE